jgi:hypothetical protein
MPLKWQHSTIAVMDGGGVNRMTRYLTIMSRKCQETVQGGSKLLETENAG